MHSDDKDQNLESGRRVQSEWDTQEISTLLIRFFLIYKFIYLFILFLVVLGLRCCTWAFSSWCRAGAALRYGALASPWGGFSCCGAWALGAGLQWLWHVGSVVVARGL